MPTPTNSVLHRGAADESRLSNLIYENEALQIEVKKLTEQLKSAGLHQLEDLKAENRSLQKDLEQLRVQLNEKTAQLNQLKTSSDHFGSIDASLQELFAQIRTQSNEIIELKDTQREKDDRIIDLTLRLQERERELDDLVQVAQTMGRTAEQETQEKATENESSTPPAADFVNLGNGVHVEDRCLESKGTSIKAQLLMLKDMEEAARVKTERIMSLEQEVSAFQKRETATQGRMATLQSKLEQIEAESNELKNLNNRIAEKAEATARTPEVDLYSSAVVEHVRKAVQRATHSVEARLREQTEQNAILLSRMALVQRESEEMMKNKGLTPRDVSTMKERVDMYSRQQKVRNTMERRVAELLSNETLSRDDIELLLQQMLDCQEEAEKESRTLLLIKDLESREREDVLRMELKRVANENASLLKQLQDLAVEGFQRTRTGSLSGGGSNNTGGVSGGSPAHNTLGEATQGLPAVPPNYPQREDPFSIPSLPPPAGVSLFNNAAPSSSASSLPVPQYPVDLPSGHASPFNITGDLWSNQPSLQPLARRQAFATHVDAATATPPHGSGGATAASSSPPRESSAAGPNALGANRSTMVQCPACTFEQRFGNRVCEICDAPLQLNRSS